MRVIAASNRDFDEMVQDGSFRRDLLYRLAIMSLSLPPLRARNDVSRRSSAISSAASRANTGAKRRDSTGRNRRGDALWLAGNIRELENVVHRQFLLAEDGVLRLDLPVAGGTRRSPKIPIEGMAGGLAALDMKAAKAKVIERFERELPRDPHRRSGRQCVGCGPPGRQERRAFGKLLKKYGIDRER